CCDDLAVSLCGDPVAYARALADLEGRRAAPVHLALAANGGALLQRVRRLLLTSPPSHAGRGPVWLAGASALVLMTGIALTAVSRDAAVLLGAIQRMAPPAPEAILAAPLAPVTAGVRSSPEVPLVQDARKAPSPPSPPSPPSVPSAPSAPTGVSSSSNASGQTSGNLSWSSNGERLEVNYTGEFEFSDDDRDVKRMAPGSRLKISDGGWFRGKSAEFTADGSGTISRRYWAGSAERPFEPEGRQWLEQSLPKFIRQTGIGAKARVARVLRNGGPSAVLTEISKIDGSYAKRLYFAELVNNASLDQATAPRVLEQAGREVHSDYELASLLIAAGDKLMTSESTRKAYFDAARGIESDFEMRRVLSAALSRGTLTPPVLNSLLETSRGIDSDYELATLLAQVAKTQSLDSARATFFAALALIDSDFEQRRAMSAVLRSHADSDESLRSLLKAAQGLDSDYERAEFLSELARVAGADLSSSARADFQRLAASIGFDHERSRALAALAKTERR
ncbi:MAG TPA: hypothetical protein VNJ03_10655, partial [Vicinamibacterales bacterium]|nr:hypothetical protein [Vicinamibacterales bacterium]